MKLVKETWKDTKLSFSSVICRTDVKDITDTIITTNYRLENYCKQQNVGFINNDNIKKSDLNSKRPHLHERGNSKLTKTLLDFIHCTCKPGTSVSCQSEVSGNCCVNKALRHFKTNHPQCLSLGHLNITSVRNKFYSVPLLIEHNIDIFALAETKLDFSFPESQFLLEGMKIPYRFDVSSRKGGLLVYVNKNVSSKYLRSFHLPNDIQAIPIEVHLKQRKLLVISICRPPDQKIAYYLSFITDLLYHYLKTYEDFIVIGDINESETNPTLDSLLDEQKCKNIIENKTCFKSVKGSCIDLILTSRPSLHQFTNVFDTGISDHHLLIYTMLKPTYTKMEPKVLSKRFLKTFRNNHFCKI